MQVLDIFAGAGGLSAGFSKAGFEVAGAIEIDDWAAETLKKNHPKTKVIKADLTSLGAAELKEFGGIDVVIGGPPCQGFSISASNRRDPADPRNYLYREFLRVVELVRPRFVLIENVKEILRKINETGLPIVDEITSGLCDIGFHITFDVLNTLDFGIPQDRARFFLLGSRDGKPIFPTPTHKISSNLFEERCPTFWEAVSDLPEVRPREVREGAVLNYKLGPQNKYQENMRTDSAEIHNHVSMRHTDRIIERFSQISLETTSEEISREFHPRVRGNSSVISGKHYSQNHRRLDPNKPSKTITASFYSSFVHPYQNRNLTVREAARIQGFPDTYIFYGKKTRLSHKLLMRKGIVEDVHLDQFNQVGNAVSPLLAFHLANALKKTLKNQKQKAFG